MTDKKRAGFSEYFIMAAVYLFTLGVCVLIAPFIPIESPLFKAGVLDGIATIIIFACSVMFNNSSMYDPYWSAAPMVLIGYWTLSVETFTPRNILIVLLITAWGARLTFNFLRRWQGLGHEDWRYANYRLSAGKVYWPLSFFGFHLFPTVIVFAAAVPIYYATVSSTAFNFVDIVAASVALSAIFIEALSDKQMRRHVLSKTGKSGTYRSGLWAYSRHPNYFGEVLFWWGMFLFALASDAGTYWTVFGPAGVTVLFVAVSLPLIEKRMCKGHPEYAQLQKEISILIPWYPKTGGNRQ